MEGLQPHSNTQSQCSSGSTVCFPPRGAAVYVPGMHPHLQWNWVLLLAMSRYIGDPNMTPDHRYDRSSLLASFDDHSYRLPKQCLPWFHSAPCKSSYSSQHSDWSNPPVKLLGGIPVEALQLHSNTQSHWSSGSTVCFPPMGQRFMAFGCTI